MRARRHRRVRGKIHGTAQRPRLSVSRSAKHITLQLIDDEGGRTLLGLTDYAEKKRSRGAGVVKTESAREAGKMLAQKALVKGIVKAVFDRGGYAYHGRVRAAAEGAREGGLQF